MTTATSPRRSPTDLNSPNTHNAHEPAARDDLSKAPLLPDRRPFYTRLPRGCVIGGHASGIRAPRKDCGLPSPRPQPSQAEAIEPQSLSGATAPLRLFTVPRRFFASSRRTRDARVGFVGRRGSRLASAPDTISTIRARACSRFLARLRVRSQFTMSSPRRVSLAASFCCSRRFW
jgi:hypothetical protein